MSKIVSDLEIYFSQIPKHKFRHHFRDRLNPLYTCCIEAKTITLFFTVLPLLYENQIILINDLENSDQSLLTLSDIILVNLLLYGNEKFNGKKNCTMLMCTIKFLKNFQRFEGQLIMNVPHYPLPPLSISHRFNYCSFSL